jgi:glutaredoxin
MKGLYPVSHEPKTHDDKKGESMNKECNCPADGVFIRAFLGRSATAEKEILTKHAAVCPQCLRKYDVLSELEAELKAREMDIEEKYLSGKEMKALQKMARERLRKLGGRPVRPLLKSQASVGVALGLSLVLIVLGYILLVKDSSHKLVLRGIPGQELQLIKPHGMLKDAPEVFVWTEVKGREAFVLMLVDEELNMVYKTKLSTPRAHLPSEVKKSLVKGKSYLWTVEALDKECAVLASDYLAFEIEEQP